jgi:hypothetical protein
MREIARDAAIMAGTKAGRNAPARAKAAEFR